MSTRESNSYAGEDYRNDDLRAVNETLDWQQHSDVKETYKDTFSGGTSAADYQSNFLDVSFI